MHVALAILFVLGLTVILLLPIWQFSRGWGYGPAVIVVMVLLVLLAMTVSGRVPAAVVP